VGVVRPAEEQEISKSTPADAAARPDDQLGAPVEETQFILFEAILAGKER
jgi:hypothetical protein